MTSWEIKVLQCHIETVSEYLAALCRPAAQQKRICIVFMTCTIIYKMCLEFDECSTKMTAKLMNVVLK